jgi:hypothetical protein
MPLFTIESTYRLPVYRHRTYEAASLSEARRLAVEDDDWKKETRDYESAGETFVTGAWEGGDAAYSGPSLQVPSHYDETLQRKADHFEVLLGLVKVLGSAHHAASQAYWRDRAALATAKAEAILAGARDPGAAAVTPRIYTLLCFDESEVRTTIAEVIAGDDALATLRPDSVTDDDVHAACLAVAAASDLTEERGTALFRAALAAIRRAAESWRGEEGGTRK